MTPIATPVPEQLHAASRRLVRTVDALTDEQWAEPSLLPGWSRAHVVAHLALNAEGLAGAVTGVVEDEPVTMYASDRARDDDIEALATEAPTEIRARLFAAVTLLADALAALEAGAEELGERVIERTPRSGTRFPAGRVATMRLREVEIHHVDLRAGYTPGDWAEEFVQALLEQTAQRHERDIDAVVVATDLDWTRRLGSGGPTVSGPAHGLAWWLTGRAPYPGAEVTSDDGVLPRIEGM